MVERRRARALRVGLAGPLGGALLACSTTSPLKAPEAPATRVVAGDDGAFVEFVVRPSAVETCRNGLDDNQNGLLDEGCAEGPASVLEFVLGWPDPEVDLNLWVIDAAGDVVDVGNVTGLGLTKQNDCPAESLCQGQNYERVVLDRNASVPFDRVRVVVEVGGRLPEVREYPFFLGVRDGSGTRAFRGFLRPGALRREREISVDVRVVPEDARSAPEASGAPPGPEAVAPR